MEIGVLHFVMRDGALNDTIPSLHHLCLRLCLCVCLHSRPDGPLPSEPCGRIRPDTGVMTEWGDL